MSNSIFGVHLHANTLYLFTEWKELTIPYAVTSLLTLDHVLAIATFLQFKILPYSFPVWIFCFSEQKLTGEFIHTLYFTHD